jgi:hypothetical protein
VNPQPVTQETLLLQPSPGSSFPENRLTLKAVAIVALIAIFLIGANATLYALIQGQSPWSGSPLIFGSENGLPTATPTSDLHLSYVARIPGPGCDAAGGVWTVVDEQSAQVRCSGAGMILTNLPKVPHLAEVAFGGPQRGYTFPAGYMLSVDGSSILNYNTCAGIFTHNQASDVGGYGFYVCQNGSWQIVRYDNGTGDQKTLSYGNIAQSSTYHLLVADTGSSQHFAVNGASLYTLDDSTYPTTAFVGLAVISDTASGGSVTFSNFVYTPGM